MDVEGWEQAGLYDPDAPQAEERRALLVFLTERGASVEQMVEAHRLGRLPAVAGDLVMATTPETATVDDVAARCGVPVVRVQRALLALGLPVAADSTLPRDWIELVDAFEQGAALMGDNAILAFTRVVGAAATNIAEAAVALFYAELGPGTEREGPNELARAQLSETATLAFTTVPGILSRVLLAQFDRANRRAAAARGWTAETASHGEATSVAGEVVALGFVDLVGSTAWAQGLSLRDHSLALSRFESAAWSSAVLAGGRVIKMIGDEVFFAAPTVDIVCRIGTDVCEAATADPVLPPARGALGYGRATPREGDYFGPLVNVVSRLAKTAAPGAMVATREAAEALPAEHWDVRELEPQPLRGLEAPIRVFGVSRASSS